MRKLSCILLVLILALSLTVSVWGTENGTEESVDQSSCEHTFGNWETVIEPNNGKPGIQARTCTICGLRETQELECLHVRTEVRNKQEAGCKDGYTGDAYCEDCGILVLKGDTVPATGKHVLGDWVTVGTDSYRFCTLCSYKEMEEDDDDDKGNTTTTGNLDVGQIIFLVVAALAVVAAVVYALYLNKTEKQATAKKHPQKKKKKK